MWQQLDRNHQHVCLCLSNFFIQMPYSLHRVKGTPWFVSEITTLVWTKAKAKGQSSVGYAANGLTGAAPPSSRWIILLLNATMYTVFINDKFNSILFILNVYLVTICIFYYFFLFIVWINRLLTSTEFVYIINRTLTTARKLIKAWVIIITKRIWVFRSN